MVIVEHMVIDLTCLAFSFAGVDCYDGNEVFCQNDSLCYIFVESTLLSITTMYLLS